MRQDTFQSPTADRDENVIENDDEYDYVHP